MGWSTSDHPKEMYACMYEGFVLISGVSLLNLYHMECSKPLCDI